MLLQGVSQFCILFLKINCLLAFTADRQHLVGLSLYVPPPPPPPPPILVGLPGYPPNISTRVLGHHTGEGGVHTEYQNLWL